MDGGSFESRAVDLRVHVDAKILLLVPPLAAGRNQNGSFGLLRPPLAAGRNQNEYQNRPCDTKKGLPQNFEALAASKVASGSPLGLHFCDSRTDFL